MKSLAAANPDGHFNAPVLEIDLKRNKRQSLGLRLHLELANLLGMNKKLAHAFGLVIEAITEAISRHICPNKPKLTFQNGSIRACKRNLGVANRLNLGPGENYSALNSFKHGIIMPCLSVFRKNGIELCIRHL